MSAERKCPLCRQIVSEELYEKITGIWKERKAQEKLLREERKNLLAQYREDKKKLEAEKRRLKEEQRTTIDRKIKEQSEKFAARITKLESQNNKLRESTDRKIAVAVTVAERKMRLGHQKELKTRLAESLKREVEKATSKDVKRLERIQRTLASTRNQMSTLKNHNLKQQQQIKALETQLKNQTTPQLEGLLYEPELMKALQREFPTDTFNHTGKGGDILHQVISNGAPVGLIVYECKKVRNWEGAHLEQAARAKSQRVAAFAILVTNATKRGTGGFFIESGVIVINPGGVLALAGILRDQLIKMAQLKLTQAEKDEAIKRTLDYLQGAEFKNSLEVVIRKTKEMYEDLKKECQDHLRGWKRRYDSLRSVYVNTARVQTKTALLIAGKPSEGEETLSVDAFPALPNLSEL